MTETSDNSPVKGLNSGKYIALFFLLNLIFFSAGCLSVDENIYKVSYTPKKADVRNVDVIYSRPLRKYIIFGDVSIRYNSGYNRNVAISYLKKVAAKNGADGIILNPLRRVEDKLRVSNNNQDDGRNIPFETYILSGSMFQYLPE